MIAMLSLLFAAGAPLPVTQAILEQKIVECGLSLGLVKDRYGRYAPDAAAIYSRDGLPGVKLFSNKSGNMCVTKWLKENVPAYIIMRENPEQ